MFVILAVTADPSAADPLESSTTSKEPDWDALPTIWVARRTDGKAGTGTKSDPFDGSTPERFDSLMRKRPDNEHVCFLPGTYETNGDAGWRPKDWQWIQGSGAGSTILRRIGVTGREQSGQPAVVGGGDESLRNHVRISDLTLDCNGAKNPPHSISRALSLQCIFARIENVEATNFGHFQTGAEMFGFGVASNVPGRHWLSIRNCYLHGYNSPANECAIASGFFFTVTIAGNVVNEYPKGAEVVFSKLKATRRDPVPDVAARVDSVEYANGSTRFTTHSRQLANCKTGRVTPTRQGTIIYALGRGGASWEGVISGNYIFMPGQVPAAFGDAGWDGLLVQNNIIYGGSLFTFDTYDSQNAIFRNNVVHTGSPAGGYCCIIGGGYHWKNWRLIENQFYLQPILNKGVVIKKNVEKVELRDNWFFVESGAREAVAVPILDLTGSNIVLKNNRFDRRFPQLFRGAVTRASDNAFLDGEMVKAIPGNTRSASPNNGEN